MGLSHQEESHRNAEEENKRFWADKDSRDHDIQIIRADAFVEMSWVHVRYAICWTHQWASKATSMQVTLQESVRGHVEKEVKLPHMWDEKYLRIRKG